MYHNRKGLTDPLNSMLANITAIVAINIGVALIC